MNRASSISTSKFLTSWCAKNGIFFDFESAEIRSPKSDNKNNKNNNQKENNNNNNTSSVITSSNGGGGGEGLAVYAKRDLQPGEMYSIIPKYSTLQASQLSLFSIDGDPEQDSSIFPQAVRSIVRGSEFEHPWWELAVLVCLHKCIPLDLLEQECIIRNERIIDTNRQKKASDQLLKAGENNNKNKILRTDFSDYLNYLPDVSPQELLTQDENMMTKKIPSAIKKDFEFNRSQNLIKSSRLTRDIPLFRKINGQGKEENSILSNIFKSRGVSITPQMMMWSYEMVTSRANNFSFVNSSQELRPYGLYPTPILGQEPTMCPVFDMMNHIRETNVLVADTLIHNGGKGGSSSDDNGEDQNENENDENSSSSSADGLAPLQQDNFTPSIVLGALRPIKKGEQIGYSYHATPDVSMSLTRWGFSPNSAGF